MCEIAPRHDVPEVLSRLSRALNGEGAGKTGCQLAPAASCAKGSQAAQRAFIHRRVQPTSGFPCNASGACP